MLLTVEGCEETREPLFDLKESFLWVSVNCVRIGYAPDVRCPAKCNGHRGRHTAASIAHDYSGDNPMRTPRDTPDKLHGRSRDVGCLVGTHSWTLAILTNSLISVRKGLEPYCSVREVIRSLEGARGIRSLRITGHECPGGFGGNRLELDELPTGRTGFITTGLSWKNSSRTAALQPDTNRILVGCLGL